MGCISSILRRIGGISSSITKAGCGIESSLEMIGGGVTSSLRHVGGISSSLRKVSGISCRIGLVCRPDIGDKYLEIEPKIIWVYPDWAVDNNVYSNTSWNVN